MQVKRARRMLDERVLCVILGDGFGARMLALGLYLTEGLRSVICDKRRSLAGYVIPVGGYYRLCPTCESELLVRQLEDMADQSDDGVRFLFLGSEEYRRFISERRDALESRYIFRERA